MKKLFTSVLLLLSLAQVATAQNPTAIAIVDDDNVYRTGRVGLPNAEPLGKNKQLLRGIKPSENQDLLLKNAPQRRMYATVPMLVTTTADAGLGSLRDVLTTANANPGNDYIISFSENLIGKTISLSSALPVINANVSIMGPNAPNCNQKLRLSRNTSQAPFIILEASGGNILIDNLVIENGGGAGISTGGIRSMDANITVSNCEVLNCTADGIGGVALRASAVGTYTFAVKNCYLHDLTGGFGGGLIFSAQGAGVTANAELSNTTITRNYGAATGGVQVQTNGAGTAMVFVCKNNTIHKNSNNGHTNTSGVLAVIAILPTSLTTTFTNNTITENTAVLAGGQGGGLWMTNGSTATLQNNLFQYNYGSIGDVATNATLPTSLGGNICSDNSGLAFLTQPSDRRNTTIAYDRLTDYSLTCKPPYHLIKCNTLAFNGGTAGADVPPTDQRGKTRTGLPDVGAVEADRITQSSSALPTPLLTANRRTICKGDESLISVGGCQGLVYWSNGIAGGSLYTPTLSQTTTLTAFCADETSDVCYIKIGNASSPVTITVNEPATVPVAAGNNATPCVLAPITLTAANCNGTIRWSDGQTGGQISSFVVQQTNFVARCEVTGCPTAYSNPVTVTPKNGVVVTASKTTICSGETVSLTATGCSGNVFWNSSKFGNTFSFTPPVPSNYSEKASVYAVCQTDPCPVPNRTTQEIIVKQSPFVSLRANSPLSAGATLELRSLGNPLRTDLSYNWAGKEGFTSTVQNPTRANIQSSQWGHYSVTIGDPTNGCSNTGNIFVWVQQSSSKIASSDEEDIEGFDLNVYPNPVNHTLIVEVKLKQPSALWLKMYDNQGKNSGSWALEEESIAHYTEIDVKDFVGGVYFLQVKSSHGQQTKKVVKVQY